MSRLSALMSLLSWRTSCLSFLMSRLSWLMSFWSALRSARSLFRSFLSCRMSFLSCLMFCRCEVKSGLCAFAPPASRPANNSPSTLTPVNLYTRMVFSPEENFRDLSGFESQKHRIETKVSQDFAKDRLGLETKWGNPNSDINYLFFNDLYTASRIPFTKEPASSDENFLAKSTASFRIAFGGVSVVCNS